MISFDNKVIKQQRNNYMKNRLVIEGNRMLKNKKPLYTTGSILIDKITQKEVFVCGNYLNFYMNKLVYTYLFYFEQTGTIAPVDYISAKVGYFKPDDNLLLVKQTDKCKLEKFQNKYYNNIYDKIKFI